MGVLSPLAQLTSGDPIGGDQVVVRQMALYSPLGDAEGLGRRLERRWRVVVPEELGKRINGAQKLSGESSLDFLPHGACVGRRQPDLFSIRPDLFPKKSRRLKSASGTVSLPEQKLQASVLIGPNRQPKRRAIFGYLPKYFAAHANQVRKSPIRHGTGA